MSTTRRHMTRLAVALSAAVALIAFALAGNAFADSVGRAPLWFEKWAPGGGDSVLTAPRLARSTTGDLYEAAIVRSSSTAHDDWVVVRYTAGGSRKWVRRLTSAPPSGPPPAVVADAAGNVVVVGHVEGPVVSTDDWLVAKWSRDGKLLWKKRLTGSAPGVDWALDVAVGPSGSFYVAGFVANSGTSEDGLLARFSAGGNVLWSRSIDGPQHGSDRLSAVAVDGKGRAYVTGHDYDGTRGDDVVIARYSPNGHLDWFRRWGDPAELNLDQGTDIAVRGSTVGVVGPSWRVYPPNTWVDRGMALSYTTSGTFKWSRIRANDSPSLRASYDLVGVDGDGRVAVAGGRVTEAVPSTPSWWITTVYSVSGAIGTVQQLHGDPQQRSYPLALVSSSSGGVYETGLLAYAATSRDAYVVSLRPNGTVAWRSRVYGPGTSDDQGGGIVVTSSAVYVAARYGDAIALLKYKP